MGLSFSKPSKKMLKICVRLLILFKYIAAVLHLCPTVDIEHAVVRTDTHRFQMSVAQHSGPHTGNMTKHMFTGL